MKSNIELSRLSRTRSPGQDSDLTATGPSIIPGSMSAGGHMQRPTSNGSHAVASARGIKARFHRFIDSFRRADGTSTNFAAPVAGMNADDVGAYRDAYRGSGTYYDDGPRDEDDLDDYEVGRAITSASAAGPRSGRYFDLRAANAQTASTLLARELKGRHLQMIAFGGSIGTGLFVATGMALSHGGPASVLLAYSIVGLMLWCTMQALGEMAVVFPVAGSFSAFSTRFLDPSWGFAMGWKYVNSLTERFP
jgi:amino acid transporter